VQFFLGIDGGGTRTRTFLVDAAGRRAAWGEAGPTNPNHCAREEVRANLDTAIEAASAKLGVRRDQCESVFFGIAGVTTAAGRDQMAAVLKGCGLGRATIGVDHDIRIALAGGLEGKPGIALIVGTGSSCYGRAADGRTWQTGGWEALIADEGSGFFVGREALTAAARMADGRMAESPLRQRVFDWLGISAIAEILPRLHDRELSRTEIAAFAPEVIALAARGDRACLGILEHGARLLAEMVEANFRMLPTGPVPQVVITGGLGSGSALYREKIVFRIQSLLPAAEVRDPSLPPVVGAALLAFEQTGRPLNSAWVQQLKELTL
jgi:N-acetylglucosamine kinase-like BadF-type ATPase